MKIFAITIASFLPVAAIAQAARNQAPDRTWITNVNIVSPQKLGHIEKGSVLIESGRMVSVQRRKERRSLPAQRQFQEKDSFLFRAILHLFRNAA